MRNVLKEMFLNAMRELDLPARMRNCIWAKGQVLEIGGDLYALDQFDRIEVIAFGKAASEMAATLDGLLGAGRAGGLVVPSAEPKIRLPNFRYVVGGHPYPNAASLEAASAALELLSASASPRSSSPTPPAPCPRHAGSRPSAPSAIPLPTRCPPAGFTTPSAACKR